MTLAGAKPPVTATTTDTLVLDLGDETGFSCFGVGKGTAPHLQPFVRREDATGCKPLE